MIAPQLVDFTASFVARWEGFWPRAYLCPAGMPSIGYGTRRYPDGRAVRLNDPAISEAQGEAFLRASLQALALKLAPLWPRPPSAHQAAAMLSLAYNIGGGAFAASTLLRAFNAGDMAGAAAQFLAWDKAHVGGVLTVLPGLAARRAAERALFLS